MKVLNLLYLTKKSVPLITVLVLFLIVGIQLPGYARDIKQEVSIDQSLRILNRPWKMNRFKNINLVRINNRKYLADQARPKTGVVEFDQRTEVVKNVSRSQVEPPTPTQSVTQPIATRPPGTMPAAVPQPGDRPPGTMPAPVPQPGDRSPGTMP